MEQDVYKRQQSYLYFNEQYTSIMGACGMDAHPVSYTHLDVYKRQIEE